VAYTTVVLIRLLFLSNIDLNSNIPTLWGSDGALYGYYAKQLLLGHSLNFDSQHIPGYLLYFLVKVSSLELDEILFYSPAFLASLSVIPVILIGYAYKILRFSFFVSIIGSITFSYYTRSYLGYYDTDVLNLFLSLSVVSFLILMIEKKDIRFIIPAIVFALIFSFWYHSSKLIIFAIILNFVLYLFISKRKYIFKNILFTVTLISVFILIGYLYFTEINSFFIRGYDYIFKVQNISLVQEDNQKLYFKNALSTINEAKALPIDKIGKYFSLNNWYLSLSIIALSIFYIRFKSFILTMSLLFISMLSLKAGIRFSEYGVLIIAFGSVYVIYILKNVLYLLNLNKYIINIIFSISLLFLLLNYINIVIKTNKHLHPIFSAQSINILHKLDNTISDKDYILTWWDYGWPLWYFTKANTLVDNAKHFEDNYIISKLLFSNQNYTANASRYFMEQCYEKRCYLSKNIFKNNTPDEIDYIISNSSEVTKTKDVYFLFHSRMIKIMKTISSFSNSDLETNLKNKNRLLNVYRIRKLENNIYKTNHKNISLDIKKKVLNAGEKKFSLNDINIANKNIKKIKTNYENSILHAIVYQDEYLILCNKDVYNSFFIQALILDNYNADKYELIAKGNEIKILKLIN